MVMTDHTVVRAVRQKCPCLLLTGGICCSRACVRQWSGSGGLGVHAGTLPVCVAAAAQYRALHATLSLHCVLMPLFVLAGLLPAWFDEGE